MPWAAPPDIQANHNLFIEFSENSIKDYEVTFYNLYNHLKLMI